MTSITTVDYTNGGSTTTETIDYDAIGNPLSYRGATMSWFGRQLRTYSKGSTTASFAYDADGLRSSKTVNGTKTEYQYVGDQLFYENRGNGNELYYFYDSYGNLSRIYHHNNGARVAYFVATNAQGDVVALYNASGVKVGAYDYDAWGNQRVFVVTQDSSGANVHTQINPETQYLTHIVNLNPIRYRGYYFDRDLGLYYLQSRYYDASIGRFINTDNITDSGAGILGYNTFMYCGNNPVNAADPTGHFLLSAIIGGALLGAVVSGVSEFACQMISNGFNTQKIDKNAIIRSAVIGGICGGISGGVGSAIAKSGLSVITKVFVNAAVDGCVNVVETSLNAICNRETISAKTCIKSFASGFASSFIGNSLSSGLEFSNTNKFNGMSKNQQKIKLNQYSNGEHIKRSMITDGSYLNTTAYEKYISRGTACLDDTTSSLTTIAFNLFNNDEG